MAVELGHQLAVRGAGGGQVVVALLELQLQVDQLLFERGDLGLELLGVVRPSDAGLAPDLFASTSLRRCSRRRTWAARRAVRASAAARSALSEARLTAGPWPPGVAAGSAA
ncbi:hypothetical protein ACIQU1_19900 [Streptomyces angustmyceticus]|uniref:hypothetical protein n=1 Tax=Streptomyces angustmyceticus TaxID=285578 RepID=UPI00381F7850